MILDRLLQTVREKGLQALVATSPDNVTYTIGFMVPTHPRNRHRRTFAVVTESGRTALMVVTVEETLARDNSAIKDIRAYNEFTENPADVLVEILSDLGVSSGRVAIELDHLPAGDYLRLRERAPNISWEPAHDLFMGQRAIKTPGEIDLLRRAGQIAEGAHLQSFETMKVGTTESVWGRQVTDFAFAEGCQEVRMALGFGERSGYTNPKPTDRELRAGDVVRADLFCTLDNYQSDVARTAVVGPPSDKYRRIWEALYEAQQAMLKLVKPGANSKDIFAAFEREFLRYGLEPTLNFVGHGIGLSLHEPPYISRYHDEVLKPGMVLCLEPVYLIPGEAGFHLEDEVIVTEDGYELITDAIDTSSLVVID